jgi:GNAT superfamily N-acetyltransferase
MTIAYSSSIEGLDDADLSGFLSHWDFEPPPGTLSGIFSGSTEVIVARDVESSVLCGYVTALSDRIACAYISALEVRPEYRRKGVATVLLARMVDRLNVFGVYLSCAPALVPFYQSAGFKPGVSMGKRNRRHAATT